MPMKTKKQQNEDAESDWDSMPDNLRTVQQEEFDPRHHEKINENLNENSMALKKTSKSSHNTSSAEHVTRGQSDDIPPYNFKGEIHQSPSRNVEGPPRPGKAKKGQSYEPLVNGFTKKISSTTYPDVEVLTSSSSSDEESENPLYSKIKRSPKPRILLTPMAQNPTGKMEKKKLGDLGQPRLSAEKLLNASPKGISNEAYETEEDVIFDKSVKLNGVVGYQESRQNPQHRNMEAQRLSISEDQKIYENDDVIGIINKKLEKCFTFVSLPFACIFLFLHHLLKFFLITLVKPVVIDTLAIFTTYFLKPLHNNVLNPIFKNIHLATLSLSNIFVNIVRPLTSLFKSCRLVEINHYNSDKQRNIHVI